MKRLLALVMTTLMLLSMLAGCGAEEPLIVAGTKRVDA